MSQKYAKWQKIRIESVADLSVGPIITEAQLNRLYRDTQIGSPVDTVEELDIQRNNLGPKNSLIELRDLNMQSGNGPRTGEKESKTVPSTEQDANEHLWRAPRP